MPVLARSQIRNPVEELIGLKYNDIAGSEDNFMDWLVRQKVIGEPTRIELSFQFC
jgi:hypothetical protein